MSYSLCLAKTARGHSCRNKGDISYGGYCYAHLKYHHKSTLVKHQNDYHQLNAKINNMSLGAYKGVTYLQNQIDDLKENWQTKFSELEEKHEVTHQQVQQLQKFEAGNKTSHKTKVHRKSIKAEEKGIVLYHQQRVENYFQNTKVQRALLLAKKRGIIIEEIV